MGLLNKAIKIRSRIMKLYEIDNPDLCFENPNNFFAAAKGRKIIILPDGVEIVSTGGHIPHVKKAGHLLKYCHKCREWKLLAAYIKNKCAKDGLKDTCSKCDSKRRRERYAKRASV